MIDVGMDLEMIKDSLSPGLNPHDIKHCILTHFHIDHTGACFDLSQSFSNVQFYAHEPDAAPIEEEGHDSRTAASCYGVKYRPIKFHCKLSEDPNILKFGIYTFKTSVY